MAFKGLELAEFAPDSVSSNTSYSAEILNVYPKNASGRLIYKPFPVGNPLNYHPIPAEPLSGISARVSGTIYNFVGTDDGIYNYDRLNDTWVDLFSTSGSIEAWEFAKFGNTICAVNRQNKMLKYTIGVDSEFTEVDETPLGASHIAQVDNFIIVGNWPNERQTIRWCAINDPTDWPVLGSDDALAKFAGEQAFPGDYGELTRIIGQTSGAAVLLIFEHAIIKGSLIYGELVFDFDVIEGSIGTISPDSVVLGNSGYAYYYSPQGFKRTQDGSSESIGVGRVDEWFSQTLNNNSYRTIKATHFEPLNMVLWSFSTNGSYNDKIIAYNYILDKWTTIDEEVQVFLTSYSESMTMEDLDSVVNNLDNLDVSLDSLYFSESQRIFPYIKNDQFHLFGGSGRQCVVASTILDDEQHRNIKIINGSLSFNGVGEYVMSVDYKPRFTSNWQSTSLLYPNVHNEVSIRAQGKRLRIKAMTNSSTITDIWGFGVDMRIGGRQ